MKRLTAKERILGAALALLLVLAGVAWWETAPPALHARNAQVAAITDTNLVDQSTYSTAQRLAQIAVTPEEQTYAQSALRVADHELDLAFTQALRDAEAHPPALNSAAAAIQARITKSQGLLAADQQRVNDLTAALAQAKADQKDKIQDQLDLAQSQLELDKDELDEASQNLVDAGGNPRRQIEAMVQEHGAQTKAHPAAAAAKAVVLDDQHGAIGKFSDWRFLRQKEAALEAGGVSAQLKAQALSARRAALASDLEATKRGIPELAGHARTDKDASAPSQTAQPQRSHEDAAALVGRTKAIAADQTILTLLNRRIADQNQLAGIYSQWASAIALQSRVVAHGILLDVLIVIGMSIVLLCSTVGCSTCSTAQNWIGDRLKRCAASRA